MIVCIPGIQVKHVPLGKENINSFLSFSFKFR